MFIESVDECVGTLNELRKMGVHLSLDDFGTGYSSLTYLRSLPVQTVKIDKTFIDLITTDPTRLALLTAIIDMAHVLGLAVVAEGVETPGTDGALDCLPLRYDPGVSAAAGAGYGCIDHIGRENLA